MISGSRTVKVLGLSQDKVYNAHEWYTSNYNGDHSDRGYDYLITRATLKASYSNATTNIDTNQCQVLVNKNMTTIAPKTYGEASNWQTDVSLDWSNSSLPYADIKLQIGYKMISGYPKISYLCTLVKFSDSDTWSEYVKVGDSYDYMDEQEFLVKKVTYSDITSGSHSYLIQAVLMRTDIPYNGNIIHAFGYYQIYIEYKDGNTWKLHILKMLDTMQGDDGDIFPTNFTPFAPTRLWTYGDNLPMLQTLYALSTNKVASISEDTIATVQDKMDKLYPRR